jgi:2-hydroxychromene-2-carboxylate isomerase
MRRPVLEFWYDFGSTYSYLAAMRIEAAAEEAGVSLVWRPFLLGPIFAAQGWTTSPFNLFPEKGRYMWRDLEREAARLGIPLRRPDRFPQNGLLAARIALVGMGQGWVPDFTRAVFVEEFGRGRDMGDAGVLAGILSDLALNAQGVIEQAGVEANKMLLRQMGEEARSRGVFGAPTFFTPDGEMFWGNDRLGRALDWAAEWARRSGPA